jgi:hypothetical protein
MESRYTYFKSSLVKNINLHRTYVGPPYIKIDINTSIYIILIYTILYFFIGVWNLRDMYELSNELGYTNNDDNMIDEENNNTNHKEYEQIYETLANSLET